MKTWVITDGKIGTEKQCLALAQLLHLKPIIKRITSQFPWTLLPPAFWLSPLSCLDSDSRNTLKEPWPNVIIGASRVAAAPVAALKKKLGNKVVALFMQNPYMGLHYFDAVIAPDHDGLSGHNLITTKGALHNITPDLLKKEGAKWLRILPKTLPRPWVTILLGGNSRHHRMDPETMEYYGSELRHLSQRAPMSFLVTASRRTPQEALRVFKTALGDAPSFFWNGMGDNPYYGLLALGDFIMVTNDSVSMLSEAGSLGKPLYMLPLKGGGRRLDLFYSNLLRQDVCRPFEGVLDVWTPTPIDDCALVLQKIKEKVKLLSQSN